MNIENQNPDDLIDLSPVEKSDPIENPVDRLAQTLSNKNTPQAENPFAPPRPKAGIFHRDDSDYDPGPECWEGRGNNAGDAKHPSIYDYELPYKSNDNNRTWWKVANHPAVRVVTVALLVAGAIFGHGILRIAILIIAIFLAPYWIINRPACQRHYNMDWEADAEPTGCLFQYYRWWRIWW